jgi:hypothetical protein
LHNEELLFTKYLVKHAKNEEIGESSRMHEETINACKICSGNSEGKKQLGNAKHE